MNIPRDELHQLRHPLMTLGIVALLAIAITQWGLQHGESAGAALAKARQNKDADAQTRERRHAEAAAIARGEALHQQFGQNPRPRNQIRLAQSESLDQIRKIPGMLKVNYQFSEPAENQSKPTRSSPFSTSRIVLTMEIIHEEVLLAALDHIHSEVDALIVLRRCQIKRMPQGTPARLSTECVIDWYSLNPDFEQS